MFVDFDRHRISEALTGWDAHHEPALCTAAPRGAIDDGDFPRQDVGSGRAEIGERQFAGLALRAVSVRLVRVELTTKSATPHERSIIARRRPLDIGR